MSGIIEGYNYDIFISYRQKDNKHDGWVTEFVNNLRGELESTFKEEVSVYFDANPHDGLLETHDVDASLKEKLKCLIFIPVISRTYCDPKSFAWEHEFKAFIEEASKDKYGLKVVLPNGNVASRVLPVQIHDLDKKDLKEYELILNGVPRGIEFIYKEPGVNRPLMVSDVRNENLNRTDYRNQINKVTLAVKDTIYAISNDETVLPEEIHVTVPGNTKPIPQEKSIIVLPFENISPDPDQEFFSDGLTEEIITDLSHIQDLLVISRSSAMTFKGVRRGIKEIAEKVNVRYVLEGSVRKAGNNLRIIAQLIDAESDTHLWSEKYSGTLDDIFDIQEKVSRSIADSLKIRLSSSERTSLGKPKVSDSSAYEQYLIARNEIWNGTKESLNHAITLLSGSLSKIGRNEYLLVALGTGYFNLINSGIDPNPEYLDKAENLIDEAIQINPSSAKAHLIKSYILETRGKFRESFKSTVRALDFDPSEPEALGMMSFLYVMIGKSEQARPYAKKAIIADPLNPLIYSGEWWVNFSEGNLAGALDIAYRMYDLDRDKLVNFWWYAYTLSLNGRIREATEMFDSMASKNSNQFFTQCGITLRHAINNEKQESLESITEEFKKAAEMDHLWAMMLAEVYSLIGQKDQAIDLIGRATRDIFINYPLFSKYDPFLENIRGEERFKKLMAQVKYRWETFEV
jgi:TolB-like protein/tetratricopeptide (TPR) repeat protein